MHLAKSFTWVLTGFITLSAAGFSQTATPATALPTSPNAADVTTPLEISARDSTSHLTNTHYVSPYRTQIKAMHLAGAVLLEAIIDTTGVVTAEKVLQSSNGNKILSKAAIDIVQHSVYKPYIHNGVPTKVLTTITVHFVPGTED